MIRNARRTLRQAASGIDGRARAALTMLEQTVERTRRIAAQTRQRLAGQTPPGADRIVSLHDGDARPIVKGRLGKPVEFGYKAQLVDNEDGVIVDHNIEAGNPPDALQLAPAIRRVKARAGRAPRAVTADRGYGEPHVEDELRRIGVRYVVLPTKGKPNAARRRVETASSVQTDGPMADRMRGTDQLRETRLRALTITNERPQRCTNMVRARHLRPQPHQDQRAHHLNRPRKRRPRNTTTESAAPPATITETSSGASS